MLQACGHTPTGVDPTPAQWAGIAEVARAKRFLCFFDNAYQVGVGAGPLPRAPDGLTDLKPRPAPHPTPRTLLGLCVWGSRG